MSPSEPEVLGYDYPEVAQAVGKSEQKCRRLAARARQHVEARSPRFTDKLRHLTSRGTLARDL